MNRHLFALIVFILTLAGTYLYITHTGEQLPALTAVHFDAAGTANSFMTQAQYLRSFTLFAVGLPLAIVILTSAMYSRASNFKLPNRDYWMAPERAAATRSFLIGHGIWFGTLLTGMLCFVHRMILIANRQQPPHLANGTAIGAVVVFLLVTTVWALLLLAAFRRPR